LGIAAAAVLLAAGVWLSGRESTPETAAAQSSAQVHAATQPQASVPEPVTPPKPKPGIERSQSTTAAVLKNAAEIEGTEAPGPELVARNLTPPTPAATKAPSVTADPSPEPPAVTIGPSTSGPLSGEITELTATSDPLPTLDAKISEGVTEGRLIRRVDPIYPMQARAQRVEGSVALVVTIAEDGTISKVKQINGSPLLATAATNAVQGWRYSPFLLNGKPVAIQKQITFVFKLP